LGQVNILYGRSQREFSASSLTTWCRALLNDKKLLFKLDLILAEKMLIRHDFFVFFDFLENSGDLYDKKFAVRLSC